MNRYVGVLTICALVFAGCTRSADPLDWKISGDTPPEIEAWFADNLPRMPESLAKELTICTRNIRIVTPSAANVDGLDRVRNLTRRLDGKTVREVLIEGHEVANRSLVARLQAQADMITRFIERHEETTPEQEKAIADRRLRMEQIKRELARSDSRLAELRAGQPKG